MNDLSDLALEILSQATKQDRKMKLIKELADELLSAAVAQDRKLKELDESINPSSYGQVVHLVLTLKELLNDKS